MSLPPPLPPHFSPHAHSPNRLFPPHSFLSIHAHSVTFLLSLPLSILSSYLSLLPLPTSQPLSPFSNLLLIRSSLSSPRSLPPLQTFSLQPLSSHPPPFLVSPETPFFFILFPASPSFLSPLTSQSLLSNYSSSFLTDSCPFIITGTSS